MSLFIRARKCLGKIAKAIIALMGSSRFFWIITGVFILQALWIAWSGAYSMAYDEFFHLAAIQEYSNHWLPIATESVAHPELGAFSRDPSFLYHYLMSFPYRLIADIWHDLIAQMIVLRLINIGLFVGGMVLFWRTLLRAGLTKKVANILLFAFSLVPTFVLVAAQLNYDNMMFLVAAATLYIATDYLLLLRQKLPPSIPKLMMLIGLLLSGSVVKYAFLPIAAAVGIVLIIETVFAFRRKVLTVSIIRAQCKAASRPLLVLATLFLLLSSGVFIQRIGVNVIRYHSPAPDCAQVISYDACLRHDAYARNANYVTWRLSERLDMQDKLTYPINWYQKMLRESFFVVGPKQIGYHTGAPLPTAHIAGYIIATTLLVLLAASGIWLLRENPVWRLWLIVLISYTAVLFALNYKEYLRLGVSVAIHGRYVVPVIILAGALGVVVVKRFINARVRLYMYVAVGILLVMLMLGGGWLPWVIRSADSWVWPHAVPATHALRSVLWYFVPK
jgi:hypothetical protein